MARGGWGAILVAVVVVFSVVAPTAGGTSTAAGGAQPASAGQPAGAAQPPRNATIEQTVTLRLTPEQPGSIAATARFDVPASVTTLLASVPANATVTRSEGFARNGTRYEWDGSTATPTLSFRVPANESGVSYHGVNATGYTFVDVGAWALVRVPSVTARWWWEGARTVTMDARVTVAGDGAVAGSVAYLGRHRTFRRTAGNATVRLVVPAAARVTAGRDAVLDALADAARVLRVDDPTPNATVVAAPQSVEWAVDGAQLGPTGAWVAADEPVADPDDVWTHEYVHTRQSYRLGPRMAWFSEASAEYYAAALAVADGRVTYAAFRRHVAVRRPGGQVLADPATWTSGTIYHKGPVVLAALDARIRAATGGTRTLVAVSRRLNRHDGTVTLSVFLDAVEAVAGPEVRAFARRAVTTDATPPLPPAGLYHSDNETAGFRPSSNTH